jgi:HK97 family phage portal protein
LSLGRCPVSDLRFSPFTGNVFAGRSYAEQGKALPTAKSMSPETAAWVRGEDYDQEGGAKLVSPYSQSTWVYVAISRLAEKISSIPFRISRMGSEKAKRVRAMRGSSDPRHRAMASRAMGETIIESGAVVELFEKPHPLMPKQLFWEMLVTWLCLRGEFFVLPLDRSDSPVDLGSSSPKVARLLTLAPDLFWHVVLGYELQAWRYTGTPTYSPMPSEMLLPSEVVHCRTPNPYLFWRGMSPLMVAMVAAGADYAAAQYNKGYWLNNADTGVIVTTDQQATPEQQAAIMAALRERKRKAGTADRPLFLFGGAKVDKPQLSGMESQFIENRKMNRQEIGAVFKVPESAMGFSDSKASALSGGGQAINAEQVLWIESTIMPLCARIETAMEQVVNTFDPGLLGWFDVNSLPIMQAARRDRVESATKMFAIGASFNDLNRVYDLGFPEYDWGDKSYLPFNIIEAGTSPEMPGEDDGESQKARRPEGQNPLERMAALLGSVRATGEVNQRVKDTEALWEKHVRARRPAVKLFESKVSKVLFEYRGKALAKLSTIDLGGLRAMPVEKRGLVDLIFSAVEFGKSLIEELSGPMASTLQQAGDEMLQELGFDDPWTMPSQKAKEFIERRTLPVQGCGETVRGQLNTSLNDGLDKGETMNELADRVRGVFGKLKDNEAERIARTETNIAYNDARQDSMKGVGVRWKAWLSSHGPKVRPAHALAEQAYIDNPVPIEEAFIVMSEKLMFPGDDSLGATAGNIINCQCIQLAAKKKAEDAKTITFDVVGAGALTFQKRI